MNIIKNKAKAKAKAKKNLLQKIDDLYI